MAGEEDTSEKRPEDIGRPEDEEEEKDDETRAAEERQAREAARKRCYKFSDPPKVYTDVKVSSDRSGINIRQRRKFRLTSLMFFPCLPYMKPEAALKDLQQLVASHISEQEVVYMSELQDYVADKSGSWSVGDEHLTLMAGFLANKDNTYAPNVPLLTLQILRGE